MDFSRKLSAVREDNSVTIDKVNHEVDLGYLPEYVHAIQWDGEKGHIEFNADGRGVKLSNIPISSAVTFEGMWHHWEQAHKKAEDEKKKKDEEAKRVADELAAKKKAMKESSPVAQLKAKQEKENGEQKS